MNIPVRIGSDLQNRSDPGFVEGLPFNRKSFYDYFSVFQKIFGCSTDPKLPFQSIFYSPFLATWSSEYLQSILLRRNSFKGCGILKATPASQSCDAIHRSTINGKCDFSHFTDKMSIYFSEGLWSHVSRGKNIHSGQSGNIPLVHAFLAVEKLGVRNFIANIRQFFF